MGLDMYLSKRNYVKNSDYQNKEDKHTITIKKAGKQVATIKPERIEYIIEGVAYWRKANQIHNWFIDNCNGGEDDNGKDIYVSQEQLKELVDTCKKVLEASKLVKGKIENGQRSNSKGGWEPILEDGEYIEDPKLAEELLPTQSGFFFGSTNYGQYYIDDLKETIKQLEPLLEEEGGDYYYTASY